LIAQIAIQRLRDRGPLEQGIYGAQKRTEQRIFVLFGRGTGNLRRGRKSAAARLYRGDCRPGVAADPMVAETVLSIWKIL
jgi:hypothetical protein